MNTNICPACKLNHARLGCEIEHGILHRELDSKRGHLVKIGGGAIAFKADLLDHHPEIVLIECTDQGTGTRYVIDRVAFDRRAFRQTLNPAFGPQLILPLKNWKTRDSVPHAPAQLVTAAPAPGPAHSGPAPAQRTLFDLATAPGVIHFRKGSGPRPRRPLHKNI